MRAVLRVPLPHTGLGWVPLAVAALVFTLMTMLAFNLFYAFYRRDLKPALRCRHDAQHVARCLSSDFYQGLAENRAPPA